MRRQARVSRLVVAAPPTSPLDVLLRSALEVLDYRVPFALYTLRNISNADSATTNTPRVRALRTSLATWRYKGVGIRSKCEESRAGPLPGCHVAKSILTPPYFSSLFRPHVRTLNEGVDSFPLPASHKYPSSRTRFLETYTSESNFPTEFTSRF